ncbi:hypothetical protein LSAT2_007851 [Lamellibrachia satsuma]|nr:hypothetical protein LSAT2_007851 [Lamellibrachia satsuma]
MYRQGFKTTLSVGERMLTAVRERSHLHTRNVRPFSNTSRLSSREEDLRHIAQHTKPNALDFKLLIWTKMYKTRAEIPESIPLTQIKRAREIGRIVVGTSITLGFLIGIPLMMMWGRHSKKSGDSIAKRRREWIRNLQRQKKKEHAAAASAENGD